MKYYMLIALALLLTSCSGAAFPSSMTRQAVQASPKAAQLVQAAQASPQAPSPTQTPEYTATPDSVGTENAAQALHDQAQATHDAQVLAQAQADAAGKQADADKANTLATESAANQAAAGTSQAVRLTQSVADNLAAGIVATKTAAAPALHATETYLPYAERDTQAHIGMQWGSGAGIFLLGLALLIVVWRIIPQREQAQQQAAGVSSATFQPAAMAPAYTSLHKRIIPAGVPESVLLTFAQHVALSDWPGGDPFTRAEWVDSGKMTRPQWSALLYFLAENKYTRPINPGVANSPLTFTPDGEGYLKRFRDEQVTSPTMAAIYPN